jgi:hypothetical protein
MNRPSIPKAVKEKLHDEYDHRCAVCGGDRPHIHHIDEDSSNNDLHNLLPLCPNCHLRDQHNPTRSFDIPKLALFRKFKDPFILKPQFHPLYKRQLFLEDVESDDFDIETVREKIDELIDFIKMFEMGNFYSKKIKDLIDAPIKTFVGFLGGGPDPAYEQQKREAKKKHIEKLRKNKNSAQELLIELLRYQKWENA